LNLNNGFNQTVENNRFEVGESTLMDFTAIRMQNENLIKLLGNNFTSPNTMPSGSFSMFEILGTYFSMSSMERNYILMDGLSLIGSKYI
jgi:hypothetical protein